MKYIILFGYFFVSFSHWKELIQKQEKQLVIIIIKDLCEHDAGEKKWRRAILGASKGNSLSHLVICNIEWRRSWKKAF